MILEFFIPYEAKPKSNSKKIVKFGGFTKLVERREDVENENNLVQLCVPYRPSEPIRGPVSVSYRFSYAWRKPDAIRRSKGKLGDWLPKDSGRGGDIDNCTKRLSDVLQRCGFLVNDGQIWKLEASKVWSDKVGIDVRIEAMNER